jgi:hypothetical protein
MPRRKRPPPFPQGASHRLAILCIAGAHFLKGAVFGSPIGKVLVLTERIFRCFPESRSPLLSIAVLKGLCPTVFTSILKRLMPSLGGQQIYSNEV